MGARYSYVPPQNGGLPLKQIPEQHAPGFSNEHVAPPCKHAVGVGVAVGVSVGVTVGVAVAVGVGGGGGTVLGTGG